MKGSIRDAIAHTDVFIGVSVADILTPEMIKSMNKNLIIIAKANPAPEIMQDLAKEAGAKIVGTRRSDSPNQINNILAFSGVLEEL